METTTINEFNKEVLINASEYVTLNNNNKYDPVQRKIDYPSLVYVGYDLDNILKAIEFLGFNGGKDELNVCAGLAQLAQRILPANELEFLDKLLVEKKEYNGEKIPFTPLKNL